MFDIKKKIRNKLMRAKNIYRVFDELYEKDYLVYSKMDNNDYLTKCIEKDNVHIKVHYRNRPERKDYKQEILYIEY